MKVTILCTYYYPYSETGEDIDKTYMASSAPELARNLVKNSHEVKVISRKVKGTKRKSTRDNVDITRVYFIDILFLRLLSWLFFSFAELIKNKTFKNSDIILCWDWSTAFPAIFYSLFNKNIRVVCSVRNASKAYTRRYKKYTSLFIVYWVIEKLVFRNVDFIIYSSKWVKKTVYCMMRIDTKHIVLHHGINTELFNPNTKSDINKKYNLTHSVIGFFGRFDNLKRVDLLLHAAKKLEDDKIFCDILLVGEGPLKGYLKSIVSKLKLKKVVFVGFVQRSEVPKYMKICDIIVLPSQAEGFSSVVLEAMAMGKVFVGTEVGGVPEIIENWKNGVRIKPNSIDDLYIVLKNLLKDKDKMKSIGKNAYNFIIEKGYNWDSYIKKWNEFLEYTSK